MLSSEQDAVNRPSEPVDVGALVLAVHVLEEAFFDAARAVSESAGLTPARWQVLAAVRDGARTIPQIAERIRLGVSRQAAQRQADVLVKDGLARYRRNPLHQRSQLLEPTAAGRRKLVEVETNQRRWAAAVKIPLDNAEIASLARSLSTVSKSVRMANERASSRRAMPQ